MLGLASSGLFTLSNHIPSRIINFVSIPPFLSLAALVVESALRVRARSLGSWIVAGMIASIAQSAARVAG
jgi:branched-subunit amino acid transport protein